MIWSIDGLEWNVPCQIERTSEMTPSEISGMLLDKSYFNDVVATYLSYSVAIAVPLNMPGEYENLYDIITEPVESHTFVLPYGQSNVEIVGRVTSVSDQYVYMDGSKNYWKGFKFTVQSNFPTKEKELEQILEHGMSPMPSTIGLEDGATFTWDATESEWNVVPDADEEYF